MDFWIEKKRMVTIFLFWQVDIFRNIRMEKCLTIIWPLDKKRLKADVFEVLRLQ